MSIKGSSPNTRQATKGGSLHHRRSREREHARNGSADSWRAENASPLLQKAMLDLFRRERTAPSPVNGQPKLHGANGNGNGSVAIDSEDEFSALLRVPPWKYALDVTLILLVLPFWLPVMLLLMLVTRLCSPGPIFYRQERIGLGGSRFLMWKFRTMKVSAETGSHERYLEELIRSDKRMTKLDASGDPRLVPLGRILRASGLDELPQIFNVFRGEMSLVGPRPCLPYEFAQYEPWQRERVNGLPGLTGYWQVHGKNKTTFSEMVVMDLSYLENMSVSLDLKIILMTGGVILDQIFEARSGESI